MRLKCCFLLFTVLTASVCGGGSLLLLESRPVCSLLFSIGYTAAWCCYTLLSRRMRFWNVLPLIISTVTGLVLLLVLLLTYAPVRLPDFIMLLSILLAIPTLYPLLGFTTLSFMEIPLFVSVFLTVSVLWFWICLRRLFKDRKKHIKE